MNTFNPPYRYLKGFALDPGFSTRLDTISVNEAIYKIPWEEVKPGPIGEYIEVIDFDPPSNCFYAPIDLNSIEVLANGGLNLSEGNPKFHQQLVYAVIMKVIRHFESALGRKIMWRSEFLVTYKNGQTKRVNNFVQSIRVYPHAFRDANAYYDPDKQAILFGYFNAGDGNQGNNFPGGVVFTCLSPDIIAHEATHAILDGIQYRFIVNTNPDVPAFHEGFSDIVALLSRFTFRSLVEHQLAITKGSFDEYSVLGELATQFGQAIQNRGALRSAIGTWNELKGKWERFLPNPEDYQKKFECHDRGAILVAAIFDAFNRLYQYKTSDLIRLSTDGTGVLPEGNISPDLVKRLADEASNIAEHLLHICIRALDYCPPMDITFGDYFRALITADLDIAPEDEYGYRISLIEAFRARGIFPDRVNTLSVESVQWAKPNFTEKEKKAFNHLANFLNDQVHPILNIKNRKILYDETQKIQAEFHNQLVYKKSTLFSPDDWESLMNKLGMTSKSFSLKYNGKIQHFRPPKTQVHKVIPAFRYGREGKSIQQIIVILSQKVDFAISKGKSIVFRGGCTLVLNLENLIETNFNINSKKVDTSFQNENIVDYVIYKNILSQRRFDKQIEYSESGDQFGFLSNDSIYNDDSASSAFSFKNLHFH